MQVDVSIVFGTRPEVIKVAPLVAPLRERGLNVRLIATGQHTDLLESALGSFDLTPHINLHAKSDGVDLSSLSARIIETVASELRANRPRCVIVQGDTTSCLGAAWAAFNEKVSGLHVEAGLRSGDLSSPWPEEMNRVLTDRLCSRHYAPTERAAEALKKEGIDSGSILVTGQTGVDAALWMAERMEDRPPGHLESMLENRAGKLLFVTAHRRENLDGGIARIMRGVVDALERLPDLCAILAAHPNPRVREQLKEAKHERLTIAPPLSYGETIWMLKHADVVLTDSGGLQEEAPSFGTPVLVARNETERPELIDEGLGMLVGTDPEEIRRGLVSYLSMDELKRFMAQKTNPFGDGHASEKIADDIAEWLNRE